MDTFPEFVRRLTLTLLSAGYVNHQITYESAGKTIFMKIILFTLQVTIWLQSHLKCLNLNTWNRCVFGGRVVRVEWDFSHGWSLPPDQNSAKSKIIKFYWLIWTEIDLQAHRASLSKMRKALKVFVVLSRIQHIREKPEKTRLTGRSQPIRGRRKYSTTPLPWWHRKSWTPRWSIWDDCCPLK